MQTQTKQEIIVEGGFGAHMHIANGEHVRITCIEGSQVCDFWAFLQDDTNEFLSAEHTRSTLEKLVPATGDQLFSNRRHAMLTITKDTSSGSHDLLMSACDPRRYELLGHEGYHRSCAENFCIAMNEAGVTAHELPSPLNIFQNVEIGSDGNIAIIPPAVEAGQYIDMRAEADLLVVVSACPMDIAMTNGPDGKTRPIKLERLSAA
ncbi:MAG: urea carboxylase-associated family protein [Pseudomonadota bacterium]